MSPQVEDHVDIEELDAEIPAEGELVTVVATAIALLDPFQVQLDEARKRYGDLAYDLDDEAGNKAARSDKRALGSIIASMDKTHAAVKAPLLQASRELDGRRKELKDQFLDLQNPIRDALNAHAAKEEARVSEIAERIAGIRGIVDEVAPNARPDYAAKRLAQIQAVVIDDTFAEWKGAAMLAKVETIEALEKLLVECQKHEAEQAELDRLRKEKEAWKRADREAKIAHGAAEKAKRDTEAAAARKHDELRQEAEQREIQRQADIRKLEENARKEREAKEREIERLKAANERAVADERARIEAEQRGKEQAEAAKRREEEVRQRDEAHRANIEGEITSAALEFVEKLEGKTFCGEWFHDTFLEAIRDGTIPHLKIIY